MSRPSRPRVSAGERDGVDQHVTPGDQVGHVRYVRGAVLLLRRTPAPGPVAHRATEAGERAGTALPDRAEADDPHRPAPQLRRAAGPHLGLRPPARPQLVLRPAVHPAHRQGGTHRPFGHGGSVEAGDVGERHAGGRQCLRVVRLHPDTRLLHEGEPGQAVTEHRRRSPGRPGANHRGPDRRSPAPGRTDPRCAAPAAGRAAGHPEAPRASRVATGPAPAKSRCRSAAPVASYPRDCHPLPKLRA